MFPWENTGWKCHQRKTGRKVTEAGKDGTPLVLDELVQVGLAAYAAQLAFDFRCHVRWGWPVRYRHSSRRHTQNVSLRRAKRWTPATHENGRLEVMLCGIGVGP